MPVINVQMLQGRTSSQKREFIKEIGKVTVNVLGVPEEAIRIVLTEVSAEHWGVGLKSIAELKEFPPQPPKPNLDFGQ